MRTFTLLYNEITKDYILADAPNPFIRRCGNFSIDEAAQKIRWMAGERKKFIINIANRKEFPDGAISGLQEKLNGYTVTFNDIVVRSEDSQWKGYK